MTPPVFYLPDLQAADRLLLEGPEARHAAVMRLRPGDAVQIVDGLGTRASGAVIASTPSALEVQVQQVGVEPEPAPEIWVAQALPKDGELAVDLLTETGADGIVPWQAERSVARWRDPAKGRAKWAGAIAAAAKQSRRARWPVLADPVDLAGLSALAASAELAIVLEADADRSITELPMPEAGRVLIMVGPEGGVSESERSALAASGAVEARLGPTVLRSAVAGAMAVAVLSSAGARWAPRGRIVP